MGKKSRKRRNQLTDTSSKKSSVRNNSSKGLSSQFSASDLLDKADELIDQFQYDLAEKFCQRAVDLEPDNIRAIETRGFLMLQAGDTDQAKACFTRSIELQPDVGHSKYMYMGQMADGHDAIQFYQTGISLMKKSLSLQAEQAAAETTSDREKSKEVTNRDISNAYCAIAEVYLTDACTEDDADVRCKENLDLAIESDPSNAEAFHTLASYWLSKDDKQKAAEVIDKGISLWLPRLQNAMKPEGDVIEDPVEVCSVSYPARIACSKTLIELENYDVASEVLELLLDENDEVVEVWYLLGLLNYLHGADFKTNARHYLSKGLELAKKLHFDDADMLQQMTELLAEIGQDASGNGSAEEDDDDVMEAEESSDDGDGGAAMEH